MPPDYAALSATHHACFAPLRGWTAREIEDLGNSTGGVLLGDEACFILARITLDEAEILTVATRCDVQRQGRARHVLTLFERHLPPSVASVFLEVATDNMAAIGLYSAFDYVQVGTRPGYYTALDAAPKDALILRKHLQGRPQN